MKAATKPLPAPTGAINYRTFERGALIFQVYTTPDLVTTFEQEPGRYAGVSADERAKYEAQDEARYEAWQADEWAYLDVVVDIRIKTETNWYIPHKIGSASLSSVESDSGADYFAEVEKDLVAEATEDARKTWQALKNAAKQLE